MLVRTIALLACTLGPPAAAQIVFEPPLLLHPASPDALQGDALAADYDGDGAPDIALLDAAFAFELTVLLGDGHGAFSSLPTQPVSLMNALLSAVDVDNDGDLDLLAQGTSSPPTALLLARSHGDGTFDAPAGISAFPSAPTSLMSADVDQDGAQDFVAASSAGLSPRVSYWRGAGDGSFKLEQELKPSMIFVAMFSIADFDSDSWLDVASGGIFPTVEIFAGDGAGSGTFVTTPSTVLPTLSFNGGFAVDDVDGDGHADLVTTEPDLIGVSLGLGNGSFTPVIGTPLPGASMPRTGDWDGDGLRDLVARAGAQLDLAFLRSTAGGHFGAPVPLSTHGPIYLRSQIDLDGDARDDAVGYGSSLSGPNAGAWLFANATYTDGEPFLDLGGAVLGAAGWPVLLCSGGLVAGRPFRFDLAAAEPGTQPLLVMGFSPAAQPVAGGTLWPTPDILFPMQVVGADGRSTLAGEWPAGLGGVQFWMQVWVKDSGAAGGWAATSGVVATGQ